MQSKALTAKEGPLGRRTSAGGGERLGRGLGWFSVGLGVALLRRPHLLAELIGVPHHRRSRAAMRAVGVRELVSGIGLLSRPHSAGFAWSRVAGDVIDVALLVAALRSRGAARPRILGAISSVVGIGFIDLFATQRSSSGIRMSALRRSLGNPREVTATLTIHRSPEELYRFWRQLDNLPRFMAHLRRVERLDERRSHWVVAGPLDRLIEWDAEIYDDRPNELISWHSIPGSRVANSGSVRFVVAPGGRGTEVHVHMRYDSPGGAIGAAVARMLGKEPGQQLRGDLRRLKQLLETGEVAQSDASIHGGMHPARPARGVEGQRSDRLPPRPLGSQPQSGAQRDKGETI